MRRRTLLYGAMAAPLLAACSGQSDDGKASGGRTTLTYGVWDVAQVPGMQKVIDAFEKENPGISVRMELTPWSSYWTTLKTAMRGGTAPDVFWMNAVNLQLYASSGVLEPLSGHIKSDATPSTATAMHS